MEASTRLCTVLIVDIARSMALRTRAGDAEAGRRIKTLLERIIALAQRNGGTFLKSYGDDVLATFEGVDQGIAAGARTAVGAQRLAAKEGLDLYAGLHTGAVEFGVTMGHPVASGQAVNLAARLHKLIDDAPGRIFIAEDFAQRLPPELRRAATAFGLRQIKGYGGMNVWTLTWREDPATVTRIDSPTQDADRSVAAAQPLLLRHGDRRLQLRPEDAACVIGRAADCTLQVRDPERRISSRHLVIECVGGLWLLNDVSRNGIWLRDEGSGGILAVRPGGKLPLPQRARLCLGRPFAADPEGLYIVACEVNGTP